LHFLDSVEGHTASSLPEVGGDACLYFDPASSDELLEKLERLNGNKTLIGELKNKGQKRISEFSWEKCAEETLQILIDTIQK
jgi:glycosyltransferase involved in cell wall biosynthesis